MKRNNLQKWIYRNRQKVPITLLYLEKMSMDKALIPINIIKEKHKGAIIIGNDFFI
jgi:hypothetical protein